MIKDSLTRHWLSALLIFLLCPVAFAQENFLDYVSEMDDTPPSSLWMEYQSNEDDSTDFYMDLGLYLNPSNTLKIGVGESQLHDAGQSIDTDNYDIQLVHHISRNIDIGIGYSYWGNKDELWTETLDLLFVVHGDDISIRLQPRFSTLNIYTVPITGQRRLVESNSDGWGVSLSYYAIKNWTFNLAATDYNYEVDLTKLNTLLARIIFSNATLLLSDNFLEKSTSFEIIRQFKNFDLGLVIGQSVSAIDHSDIDNYAINLEWYIHPDYSLFMETGETIPESGDPGTYVTAGFSALF
ncbi:MAG: hypothetical protein P8Y24_13170 [Gammaproteobacteria bacterium]